MQDVTLISMPLTLLSPLFYLPLLHLSCSIASPHLFIQHSLAASLMSVLSCGPPFHTAAFTIMSITSNYLAVFPLLTLSPAFILVLELYAFQMGATAFPLPPYPVRDGEEEEDRREQVKTNLVCHRWGIVKPGWADLHHRALVQTNISVVIGLFHCVLYLPSTLHWSPFILHRCFA